MESFSRGIGSIGVLLGVVAAMFGSLGILASTENEFHSHPDGLAVGLLLWAIAAALLAFRHRVTVYDDPRRLVRRRGFGCIGVKRHFDLTPDACVEIIHTFVPEYG